ncbi:MAG: hypothetical protein ACXADU_03485 [Promethearchaeota archaeon]|jgi:hypothetical protein
MKIYENLKRDNSILYNFIKVIKKNKYDILGISIASILYLLLCFLYLNFIIDDSFISYRYSEHLANGRGLDWNFGTDESKNQGYSNFLWVILISLFVNFADPILISRIISIICGIGTFIVLNGINKYYLSDNLKKNSSFFCIILACIPEFSLWTVGGLETILFVFLIISGFYFWIKENFEESKRLIDHIKTQIFFSLAILTRIEGLLVFSMIILIDLLKWIYKSRKYKELITIISKTFLLVIIIGAYFIFSYLYYGQLLPNSFYRKKAGTGYFYDTKIEILNLQFSSMGIKYIINFFLLFFPFFLSLIIDTIFIFSNKIKRNKKIAPTDISYIVIILLSMGSMTLMMPLMGQFFRFFIHLLPLLIIGLVKVYNHLNLLKSKFINRIPERLRNIKRTNLLKHPNTLISLIIISSITLSSINTVIHKINADSMVYMLNRSHIPVGMWLYNTFPSDTRIGMADCGAVPYYSKMWVCDIFGLNSKEFLFGLDIDYLASLDIDIFILNSASSENYTRPPSNQRTVYDSDYLQGNFTLRLICPAGHDGYSLFVFLHDDLSIPVNAFDDIPSHWIIK